MKSLPSSQTEVEITDEERVDETLKIGSRWNTLKSLNPSKVRNHPKMQEMATRIRAIIDEYLTAREIAKLERITKISEYYNQTGRLLAPEKLFPKNAPTAVKMLREVFDHTARDDNSKASIALATEIAKYRKLYEEAGILK